MFSSPWIRKPDFTNVVSFDYDAYWARRGWALNDFLKPREEVILDMIPSGARVIDIGCGNSLLPVRLKEKGVHIEVADVSEKVLEGYAGHGILGLQIDLEKVTQNVFTKKYDYIVLSEVLEHTRNPEMIIATLKEHTRSFVITVPNSAAYLFRYSLLVRGRFFTQWVMHPSEHLRFWSHIDFMDWLRAFGLTIDRVEVSDGFTLRGLLPWLPRVWKNMFGFRMVYLCSTNEK